MSAAAARAPGPELDVAALQAMLAEQARIGATPEGGLHRLAASPQDGEVRDWLSRWFRDRGLREVVDPVGNQFGVLEFAGPRAPWLLTGSHLDSQPNGGALDGCYGVVASCQALDAIRAAIDRGAPRPRCNLAAVNWTNEEGARFQPSILGSSVFAGSIDAAYAHACADAGGVTLADELERIGYRGAGAMPAPVAYVELHVECGPELDDAGLAIGVVERWWGAVKLTVELTGRQAHTGPTAMAQRRDALYGAALTVEAVRRLADDANAGTASDRLRSSVGRIELEPNSPNVVPSRVALWVELRSPHSDVLERARQALGEELKRAAAAAAVGATVVSESLRSAGAFDAGLVELAEATARERGHAPARLETIAAHDAIAIASVAPSVVINVPSIGGVCHHPDEATRPEDLIEGAHILLTTLWQLCAKIG